MALLKGKGAMTGVNLIARVYRNGATKDGKSHYIDIQVDARDSRGREQTNLHLKSERVPGEGGKIRFNNKAPYSVGQLQEIVQVAGPNTEPLRSRDNEEVGTLYGFKGNVMPASRGPGLVVNTNRIEPSDFKVDATTLDNQFTSMRDARKAQAAAKGAQVAVPTAEQAAESERPAELEEPAIG